MSSPKKAPFLVIHAPLNGGWSWSGLFLKFVSSQNKYQKTDFQSLEGHSFEKQNDPKQRNSRFTE